MKLDLRRKSKRNSTSNLDDDEVFAPSPPPPWRLTRQARDTMAFCLLVGLLAAMVWGVYRWTNASRYTPPLYNGTTTLHQ